MDRAVPAERDFRYLGRPIPLPASRIWSARARLAHAATDTHPREHERTQEAGKAGAPAIIQGAAAAALRRRRDQVVDESGVVVDPHVAAELAAVDVAVAGGPDHGR